MILVLAFGVLVALGFVAVGVLGVASSKQADRDPARSLFGGTRSAVLLAAGAAVLVLLGAAVVATVGLGGGGDEGDGAPRNDVAEPTARRGGERRTSPATVVAPRVAPGQGLRGPDVSVEAGDPEVFAESFPVVDRLPDQSVLHIAARGFEPYDVGSVEQCVANVCGNAFPVVFDGAGTGRFQYLVRNTVAPPHEQGSRCRADEPPCVVRVRSESATALFTTVFGDTAPAPRHVTVEPRTNGVVDGATVSVSAVGFMRGERVRATLCVAPHTSGDQYCGAPAPVAHFTIGPDGKGATTLEMRTGRVGAAGDVCGRDARCGIVVATEGSVVPAPVVPVTFSRGSSAQYDTERVAAGFALAIVLFAFALLLGKRTDWRKPTEADTPELDRAVLADS